MKFLLTLVLFITTNAFATEICSHTDLLELQAALETEGNGPIRTADDHAKFTSVEKSLIHRMVNLQKWDGPFTQKEALEVFADMYNGEVGFNAGEILYYNLNGKQVILVHYYPGDNEYGAFFALNKNGSYKLIAEIGDSEILCK